MVRQTAFYTCELVRLINLLPSESITSEVSRMKVSIGLLFSISKVSWGFNFVRLMGESVLL